MLLHFKYSFLELLRNRPQMFWAFAFPLLVGTMFHLAFGRLDADELFSPVPVAVVLDAEHPACDGIRHMLDALSEPEDDPFLIVTYVSMEDAEALLSEKEVYGILHMAESRDPAKPPLCLTLSAEMSGDPLYQSILNAFVDQFNLTYAAIADIAQTDPAKLSAAMESLSAETAYLRPETLETSSMSQSASYFFSLIAMSCLFAATAGSEIAITNQANLSPLGARKCVSPVRRSAATLCELSALLLQECVVMTIALLYYRNVLSVDFGSRFGYVLLATLCGCLAGISLGYFVGSIGQFGRFQKNGILVAIIMTCSMLSGLMINTMRLYVEAFCPLLNRINPAALISDALYALAVYPSPDRYFKNIAGLLTISALFCLGGIALTRRKKYAGI